MPIFTVVILIVGLGAFLALSVAAHRGASAQTRMVLTLIATAALILVFTGQAIALAFYVIDIALVIGTWRLSRTRVWKAWIVLIALLLIASKLPGAVNAAGLRDAVNLNWIVWLGFSYLAFRLIHVTYEAHNKPYRGCNVIGIHDLCAAPCQLCIRAD